MNVVGADAFTLYPAIDVRSGRVVRLRQGDFAHETAYAADPLRLAASYAAQGARWLHLVDLDGARNGGYTIAPLLQDIVRSTGLRVQTGGGVRTAHDVARLFDAGADRVVVGSIAVRDPDTVDAWLERFGHERLVLALDVRQGADGAWQVATDGWTRDGGVRLDALAARHAQAGVRHVLCTDIGRDGMLGGPNLDLYAVLRACAQEVEIQGSGGVRDAGDIAALRAAGCSGAVLGRALLEGGLTMAEAVAC